MTTSFVRFVHKAEENPKERFSNLMGILCDSEGLRASFDRQAQNKAPGIDKIRKTDYALGVESRIESLSKRLCGLRYKPKPSRRAYIPKSNGDRRPLGIPSFEDRIVQDRLSVILQTIWEPEFRNCSYGFRPNRNAHGALKNLGEIIRNEQTQYVVEADIKGFFDHVSHYHLLRFLRHRISDKRLIRIIQRFLKAGVLEDGVVHASGEGTPQGGLVSPVLANIYLHYVLDMWFEIRFAKSCQGKARLVRYADDFVACFQKEEDARRFVEELTERLAAFDLEVEPSKTKLLLFGNQAWRSSRRRPRTFNFLGFTHYVGRSRGGYFVVGRKIERKRMRNNLKTLKQRLISRRALGRKGLVEYAYRHIQGHIQYYGISGNSRGLSEYVRNASELLFKWMNRCSQRRSITFKTFRKLMGRGLLPKPRIVHRFYPGL